MTTRKPCAPDRDMALQGPRGQVRIWPKPKTEDPFINCKLTSVGTDNAGDEWFIISSLNTTTGARTLALNARGDYRELRWRSRSRPSYCYGATLGEKDTLWLGGSDPSAGLCLWRLNLSTGAVKRYPVPAGHFITSGMAYDAGTKKLFTGCGSAMVSFDTVREEFVRVYTQAESGPSHFHHFHWPNGDGTYGFLTATPGITYVRWFPHDEKITYKVLTDDPRHPATHLVANGPCLRRDKLYVPHLGWLNGRTGRLTPAARPPREEAAWFGVLDHTAYGAQGNPASGDGLLLRWDMKTGDVRTLASLPDQPSQGCALTCDGRILCVDLHGLIRRIDPATGALELTRKYEHRSVHIGRAVCPAGEDRIVGTPFICQNFWILNTKTGEGVDAGRAAGLYGQIDDAAARSTGRSISALTAARN